MRGVLSCLAVCVCLACGCGKKDSPREVSPTSRSGSPERVYASPPSVAADDEAEAGGKLATLDKWQTQDDRKTVRRIRLAIMADDELAPSGTNLVIDVQEGKVKLSGKVPSKQHRRAIAAMVEKQTGTQPLNDTLEVITNRQAF